MSESPRPHAYVCHGCQTTEDKQGNTVDVDKIRRTRTVETARTLARIHRIRTGHDPQVVPNHG